MRRANRAKHLVKSLSLLVCLVALLVDTAVRAQEEPSVEASGQTEPVSIGEGLGPDNQREKEGASTSPVNMMTPPMMPAGQMAPAFGPEHYDWIRLTSGEWLKGDILTLRDEKLEFDSDEMDEQTFDWEDVAEVRSSRLYSYVFTDRTSLIGTALILDEMVVISSDGEDRVRKRSELMSIVPAAGRERDHWDGKASAGLSFRRGNTEKTEFTYQGFVRRQDKLTRTRLDFNGAIGEDFGEQNVNNHRSILKLDLFATPRFYITLWNVRAYPDKFQNIDIQVTPSAGIGYHAIKRKKITCDLESSGGYQYTRYRSVQAGADEDKWTGSLTTTIRMETDPLEDLEADFLYSAQLGIPDTGDTTMHGELVFSIELTKVLDVDISWIWDRVVTPEPREDGSIPKQHDVKLTVGLGIDF